MIAELDFETYSEAGHIWNGVKWGPPGKRGLPIVGVARYAEHPTTEVLCLAYDTKDGRGPRQWLPGQPPPLDLFLYLRAGNPIEAWNVSFERWIWEKVCVERMGWPAVHPSQWRCCMAKARAHALPGSLGKAAEVLELRQQKDRDGDRLLKKFSVPRNPTKGNPALRLRPEDDPEDGAKLAAYNRQDIAAEAEASGRIPDLSPQELEVWRIDQAINHRGVAVDVEGVEACIAVLEQAYAQYNSELPALTDGAVSRASEVAKLIAWLHGQGVHTDSLDEDHLTELLARADLPLSVRRVLEIRALIGSAAVKKVYAMRNQTASDGRIHDLFVYHGARTGRVTGSGPQPTNLPNSGPAVYHCESCERHYGAALAACPWCGASTELAHKAEWSSDAAEDAIHVIKTRSLACTEYHFGAALAAISGCLRGLFVAGPGKDLICSDYSAIEAVVLAELAGESWRQEVFRTHGKIYEASAAAVSGVPLEEILEHKKRTGQHHPLRKMGKVMELACGYQGWIGAMRAFGADAFMDEEQMKTAILQWRDASPAIVALWYGVEGHAASAIRCPGQRFHYRGHAFEMQNDVLYLTLLSGRRLTYHRPRLTPNERRPGEDSISYEGWNSNPMNGQIGWIRMPTWGGRIVENIIQATARDIQWHGIIALERAGYPVVLHVYDEDVAEVPEGFGSVEEFESIMSSMPTWAKGWPVRASGGWRGKRYRK